MFFSADKDKTHKILTMISDSPVTKTTVDRYVATNLALPNKPRANRIRLKISLSGPVHHNELKSILSDHCGEVRYLSLLSKSGHPHFGENAVAVVLATQPIPAKLTARCQSRQFVISVAPHENQTFIPAKAPAQASGSPSSAPAADGPIQERKRTHKTALCVNFSKGKPCAYNPCRFVHENPPVLPSVRSPPQRAILCRDFGKGLCARGDVCKFAHLPLQATPWPPLRRRRTCEWLWHPVAKICSTG